MEAIRDEDRDRAKSLWELVRPFQRFRGPKDHVAAVKTGQDITGLVDGPTRSLHRVLTQEEQIQAVSLLEDLDGEDFGRPVSLPG